MSDRTPPAETTQSNPYWWDAAPRRSEAPATLPERVDVAIVGAGYTGLSAALTLARRSREVLVFDAEAAGSGASSRNQGHLGVNRHFYAQATAAFGKQKALQIFREDEAAIDFTVDLIQREKIECYLQRNGRFVGAAKTGHYDQMAREAEALRREIGYDVHTIPRAEVRQQIGTDDYVGGEVRPREGCVHSALFHNGLLDRALRAGARVVSGTPVQHVERTKDGFVVSSPKGKVHARDVLIATNALSGDLVPYIKRRILPYHGAGIVTEPLSPERIRSVVPAMRPCVDTRKLGRTVRPSPDGTRIVFGGRATMAESDPGVSGVRLGAIMRRVFPQLSDVRITHSWFGPTGITFQKMPHIGLYEGMHCALGYSPYGVAQAPYLGHKAALRILRANDAATAFDDLPFETRPLYFGNPWFLPAVVAYYRYKDFISR
ncbi:MAG: FAD-binding oxidoreductase [Alphaproteobacteria bacterium]|nr:FAD-binding oxidoreductase [Alphaproteobacteria bacterium]